jgi:hypothetical protein
VSRPTPHPGSNYWRGAAAGLAAGVLIAAIALHRGWTELLSAFDLPDTGTMSPPAPQDGLGAWIDTNLGASWIPFSILALLYVASLLRARRRIGTAVAPAHSPVLSAGLLQLWSSTFFGIGVLWTAIGMRSALLNSLSDLGPAGPAGTTAFDLMNRLVDGGVLTALTTTIVGGAGSYLMNVLTQLYVVLPAQREAARLRAIDAHRLESTLERIAAAAASKADDPTPARHREDES